MRRINIGLILIQIGFFTLALIDLHRLYAQPADVAKPENALVTEPAPVPTPAQITEDVGQVEKLWRSGAITSSLILAAWLALTIAARKVKWLAADHRAVYVSVALGALAMLVDGIQRGQTPNISMIATAIVVALGIAQDPRKPAEQAAKAGGAP